MNLQEEIEEILIKKAKAFSLVDQKVYMEYDTATVIVSKVLDAAVEAAESLNYHRGNSGFTEKQLIRNDTIEEVIEAINKMRGD